MCGPVVLVLVSLVQPISISLGRHGVLAGARQNPFQPNHGPPKLGLLASVITYGFGVNHETVTHSDGSKGYHWWASNIDWSYEVVVQ